MSIAAVVCAEVLEATVQASKHLAHQVIAPQVAGEQVVFGRLMESVELKPVGNAGGTEVAWMRTVAMYVYILWFYSSKSALIRASQPF